MSHIPKLTFFSLIILAIIAGDCLSTDKISSTEQQLFSKVDDLVQMAWQDIKPKTGMWTYKISPLFPEIWPSVKDTNVTYFIFAIEQDPQSLKDGEQIAAPWAEVKVKLNDISSATLTIKQKTLLNIGIQGIRPLEKKESEAISNLAIAQHSILSLSHKDDDLIKRSYCAWKKNNAVISEEVKKRNPSFF